MNKSDYQDHGSFSGKMRIAFCFLSIVPYLIVIYLFVMEKIEVSDMILLFSPLILFSILTGFSIIRRSADQLVKLAGETRMMEEGERSAPVRTNHTDKELNDIARHFNSLFRKLQDSNRDIREQSVQLLSYAKDLSLSYKRAKEEERLRNRLSRYVGSNLVEKLMSGKGEGLFDNERKELTVLFADIRGFTSIAESMAAENVVAMLNQFFDVMVAIIFNNRGVLDKFVGDQIVALFGLLPSDGEAAKDAVSAALKMQAAAGVLMEKRTEQKLVTFKIGIGINTGNVIVGNVGSQNRMDYTVIGDCVNVAARLQNIAEGGQTIIGEETYSRVKGSFTIEKKLELSLKNRTAPIRCYSLKKMHDA